MGYNSMPYLNSHVTAVAEFTQNDDVYPWERKGGPKSGKEIDPETKYPYGNHVLYIHIYVYVYKLCAYIELRFNVDEYMIYNTLSLQFT